MRVRHGVKGFGVVSVRQGLVIGSLIGVIVVATWVWWQAQRETMPSKGTDHNQTDLSGITKRVVKKESIVPAPELKGSAKMGDAPVKHPQGKGLLEAPLEERQAYYDEMSKRDTVAIWQEWQTLLRGESDLFRRDLCGQALFRKLRTASDAEWVFVAMGTFLEDPSRALAEKSELLALLGRVSTPSALKLLLRTERDGADPALRAAAVQQIARAGSERWNGVFHPELSPLLEERWKAGDGGVSARAVATALAEVGAPDGVRLMLTEVFAAGQTLEQIKQSGNVRALSALAALRQVQNPAAVPVFAEQLWVTSEPSLAATVAGETLAGMGCPEATGVLLEWARKADDSQAGVARAWFLRLKDTASRNLVRETLEANKAFRSNVVREAVAGALADRLRPFQNW